MKNIKVQVKDNDDFIRNRSEVIEMMKESKICKKREVTKCLLKL